jgi:hypothetical protein
MIDDSFELKLKEYYHKIHNPKYKIDNWIVADDTLYLSLKNKLKISSVLAVNKYINEDLIIIETKNEYYAIKYNGNFICLKKSETEYGLVTGEYQLLAIHMSILKEVTQKKIPKFNNICKMFNWSLTNKAKEELSYKYLTKT